jgi:hypothetical protein
MSLYNNLFGLNHRAPTLLACLGLHYSDIPRFRDCYLRDNAIVIYTRTGGENRLYYENLKSCRANYPEYFTEGKEHPSGPWNDDIRRHPQYVSDIDCDFDSTYAYFFFSFPDAYRDDLHAISAHEPDHTPSLKWKALTDDLSK